MSDEKTEWLYSLTFNRFTELFKLLPYDLSWLSDVGEFLFLMYCNMFFIQDKDCRKTSKCEKIITETNSNNIVYQ
jgi:hypothetical protein